MHFDLVQFITNVGYAGVVAIIFAESGLFFGFFLPGDSLLLTAGLLASRVNPATGQPFLNIWLLIPLLFVAAVLGDNVGYWFGAKTGPRIFSFDDATLIAQDNPLLPSFLRRHTRLARVLALLFRRKNLLAAKAFYDKHGGKTITLARFMPFIRTFAPIVAGAVEMEYRRFMLFNLVGGLVWAVGVTLAGYYIGYFFGSVEGLDRYFTLLVIAVIFISALPAVIHVWRDSREEILAWLRASLLRRREPEVE